LAELKHSSIRFILRRTKTSTSWFAN
jgi:hypothetical protein